MIGKLIDGDFVDFCRKNQIIVNTLKNVGSRIKGFCYYDGQNYHVFLNNRFDQIQLRKTVVHEMIHIFGNHFNCEPRYIETCEIEVNNIIKELLLSFI